MSTITTKVPNKLTANIAFLVIGLIQILLIKAIFGVPLGMTTTVVLMAYLFGWGYESVILKNGFAIMGNILRISARATVALIVYFLLRYFFGYQLGIVPLEGYAAIKTAGGLVTGYWSSTPPNVVAVWEVAFGVVTVMLCYGLFRRNKAVMTVLALFFVLNLGILTYQAKAQGGTTGGGSSISLPGSWTEIDDLHKTELKIPFNAWFYIRHRDPVPVRVFLADGSEYLGLATKEEFRGGVITDTLKKVRKGQAVSVTSGQTFDGYIPVADMGENIPLAKNKNPHNASVWVMTLPGDATGVKIEATPK